MAFCGAIPLLLGMISLVRIGQDRFIAFWTLTGLLMMGNGLGKHSPIYDMAYHFVPGINLFKAVAKFRFFSIFAVGVLAGKGLDILLAKDPEKKSLYIRVVIYIALTAGFAGIAISLLALKGRLAPFAFLPNLIQWVQESHTTAFTLTAAQAGEFTPYAFKCIMESLLASALAITGAALAVIFWMSPASRCIQVVPVILLSILAVELYRYDFRYIERSKAGPPIPVLTKTGRGGAPNEQPPMRIAAMGARFEFLNRFIYDRLHEIGGYENHVLKRYDAFARELTEGQSSWNNIFMQLPYHETVYDMLNVKYLLSPITDKKPGEGAGNTIVHESVSGKYGLFSRTTALARAFIIHEVRWADSVDDAVKLMPGLLKRGAVTGTVIESADRRDLEPIDDAERKLEKAEIISYTPNEIHIKAELVKPGFLVVSDNIYPGWEVRVNGKTKSILPANVFMRAVYLEKGQHSVIMEYKPKSFTYGATVSGVAVMICLFLLATAIVSTATSSKS